MVTDVKERPILFSGPMVQAILAGRKTQTRRVAKVLNEVEFGVRSAPLDEFRIEADGIAVAEWQTAVDDTTDQKYHCPYGKPGDRLWVRETWMPLWDSGAGFNTCLCPTGHENKPDVIKYRADGEKPENFGANWRPSIHMPRKASRITLEITGVRVERLQDISEDDAACEGVTLSTPEEQTYYGQFRKLWGQINGPGSWDANPWCWVVEFKRA